MKEQLQIIPSLGDNWIVASPVGCKGDTVLIYDLLFHSLDKGTIAIVGNLVCSTEIRMIECQKQDGEGDCGLFAIANATAIANGIDLTEQEFNQGMMRRHLMKCFECQTLSLFP